MKTPLGIESYITSEEICDELIAYYNSNQDKVQDGVTMAKDGEKIDKSYKDSKDISLPNGDFKYFKDLFSHAEKYVETYDALQHGPSSTILEPVNIQKYPKGGGFKQWHFERASENTLKRSLVFMTYLNTCDGGTEFKYQEWTAPCKKGLTLIWPPDFLFTHRGVIDYNHEKMIVTGWLSWNI
jgi:hypothetical protein